MDNIAEILITLVLFLLAVANPERLKTLGKYIKTSGGNGNGNGYYQLADVVDRLAKKARALERKNTILAYKYSLARQDIRVLTDMLDYCLKKHSGKEV